MALIWGGTEVKAERWDAATAMSATTSRPLFTPASLPAAERPELTQPPCTWNPLIRQWRARQDLNLRPSA